MAKNLVIVESPAKAKTIEGYLGKDFTVKSSYGHVRDLASKDLSIDIENGFKPVYEVSSDKKALVSELKKLAKSAEVVWLATDEDREGEAISWHLSETLGLDDNKTKRIVFNEITKTAIERAIANPRKVNQDLVNAQQARRVLDRLVGYEISPILWRKVRPSLSAGRVQSVAVRLIVEREREIQDFKSSSSYRVVAKLETPAGSAFEAQLAKRLNKEEAAALLNVCKGADFSVTDVEKKPAVKTPAAPFTTSTLQQEASRKLGYSVAQTMQLAQRLYEAGHITYMRTDSVNLSDTAIQGAQKAILNMYGEDFSNPKKYATRNKSAQEAHEAIRPTDLSKPAVQAEAREQRLYDLIWKRTIASQMTEAQLERTTARISISGSGEELVARGEVLKFEGFLKVYLEGRDDEPEEEAKGMLPALQTGQSLKLQEMTATERFTQHPPRYAEASLVKKLEELGIGRPSTYAPTISTIQKRGYVSKESRDGTTRKYELIRLSGGEVKEEQHTENTGAEKNKLFPTDIGMVVNDFLIEHFAQILEYNFTADVEKEFDEIAQGEKQWDKMIAGFYKPFHHLVEQTLEHSERATGERELGTDPASGKRIIARIGRYGPMVQIGQSSDEEKPRFASLLKDQSISTITLEEALKLFLLPRKLGTYKGQEVVAAIGRFGPFVRHGKLFASIPKDLDVNVYEITLDQAAELIEAKMEQERNRMIKTFPENEDVQVLNGRFGPYIKIGKDNFKIPKDLEPASLTLDQCLKIAEEAPKTARRGKSTKAATSKAAKPKKAPAKKKPAAKKTGKTSAKK
ncbi:MAG: type I DNA topoisomerase [Cryomorphaceae bacterium]|nr:MAG: type I DNA topoisomerase [Cryomorphaceae bacterium]